MDHYYAINLQQLQGSIISLKGKGIIKKHSLIYVLLGAGQCGDLLLFLAQERG